MDNNKNKLSKRGLPKLTSCLKKRSLEDLRHKLIFDIPTLTIRELRRSKRPFYECLLLELEESGFVDTAQYIKDLIDINTELLQSDDIGRVADLRKENKYLEWLSNAVKDAEKAKYKGNTLQESISFSRAARRFAGEGQRVRWLAERLHLAAVGVARALQADGGKQLTIASFAYCQFLVTNFSSEDSEDAYDTLVKVREQSAGRNWVADDSAGEPHTTVYQESNLLLQQILLQRAAVVRVTDPGQAERLSRMAERRGLDAGMQEKVAEAVTATGECQLAAGDLNSALKSFLKALKIQAEANDVEGQCIAHMHIANALQRLSDLAEAEKHLNTMGTLAIQNHLTYQLAVALQLLGELFLKEGMPVKATPHLREAFKYFMGTPRKENMTKDDKEIVVEQSMLEIRTSSTQELGPLAPRKAGSQRSSLSVRHRSRSRSRSRTRKSSSSRSTHDNLQLPKIKLSVVMPPQVYVVVHAEEADKARMFHAISAGQEVMGVYFRALEKAHTCMLMRLKLLDWKFRRNAFWICRVGDDAVPCPCVDHRRTPLQIALYKNLEWNKEEYNLKRDYEKTTNLLENISPKSITHSPDDTI